MHHRPGDAGESSRGRERGAVRSHRRSAPRALSPPRGLPRVPARDHLTRKLTHYEVAPARPPGHSGTFMLQVAGISKAYGGQVVLADVSWAVHEGARVGLTGPNGAGKSTLLRIIAGEVEPD